MAAGILKFLGESAKKEHEVEHAKMAEYLASIFGTEKDK